MKTQMNIDRMTVIPNDRFWQEVFLVSLACPNQGVNGAVVDADSALKIFQKRREDNARRSSEFVS